MIELVEEILVDMPTADFAGPAWRDHGEVAVVETLDEAYALVARRPVTAKVAGSSPVWVALTGPRGRCPAR